jgi:hypothetical protein
MVLMLLLYTNGTGKLIFVFYTLILKANTIDDLSLMILSFCTAEHFRSYKIY